MSSLNISDDLCMIRIIMDNISPYFAINDDLKMEVNNDLTSNAGTCARSDIQIQHQECSNTSSLITRDMSVQTNDKNINNENFEILQALNPYLKKTNWQKKSDFIQEQTDFYFRYS